MIELKIPAECTDTDQHLPWRCQTSSQCLGGRACTGISTHLQNNVNFVGWHHWCSSPSVRKLPSCGLCTHGKTHLNQPPGTDQDSQSCLHQETSDKLLVMQTAKWMKPEHEASHSLPSASCSLLQVWNFFLSVLEFHLLSSLSLFLWFAD